MKKAKKLPKNIEHELSAIERFVDKAIPFLVIILAFLIILNFTRYAHSFEPWTTYADWIILAFFIVDLVFKWRHVRKLTKFIRLYWLDILAVFPFYLLMRAYSTIAELVLLGERISEAQQLTHETLLLRETRLLEELRLFEESEKVGKEAKFLPRIIRFIQRILRFIYGSLHIVKEHLLHISRKNKHKTIFSK